MDAGRDARADGDAEAVGSDASSGDAGAMPDADTPETVAVGSCALVPQSVLRVEETGIKALEPIAVSLRNEGGTLAWVGFVNGGKYVVNQRWFPNEGLEGTAPELFATLSNQSAPSSTATASGHLTVWVDDADGPTDIRVAKMSADGVRTEQTVSWLTRDAASDLAPVVASSPDGSALVVWQSKLGDGAPIGHAQPIDAAGAATGSVATIASYGASIGHPALARFLTGYLLAWTDAAGHVHLQNLDAQGAPMGNAVQVDGSGGAQGNVDIATSSTGGAVVFDVRVAGERPEARIRTFDERLAFATEMVVGSTDTGSWPSVAPLNGGFAVSYRSTNAEGIGLRVALHGSRGTFIAATTFSPLASDEEATALRISPDGQRLMLAWRDWVSSTNRNQLYRAWVRCD